MLQCVILDRDGVINLESPAYIKSPEEWIPIEGSLAAISRLNRAGIKVAVATNQSGVARGYYTLDVLSAIHEKMHSELTKFQGFIDLLEYCPHHPDALCECRKPKSGMLIKICHTLSISYENAVMIGDSQRDIIAAENIGMPAIHIGKEFKNLWDVVDALLSRS